MNDFDDMINSALTERADGAPTTVPDFGTVLDARQDKLRRRTALAAGGLVVAGLAGIGLFATAGDESPSVAGQPSSTRPLAGATSTIPPGGDIDGYWFCTGRIDDPFGGVPPTTAVESSTNTTVQASTTTLVPGAAPDSEPSTTLWAAEDSGYFERCRPAELEEFPATTDADVVAPPMTTSSFDTEELSGLEAEKLARLDAEAEARRAGSEIEARRLAEQGIATHVVGAGDFPMLIAERYCVSVEDLLEFNGWTSVGDFPFPNELVMIPPSNVADCVPPPPTTAGG